MIMQPTDTIKTRFQSAAHDYRQGIWHAFQNVARHEGIAGFYKGTVPVLCIVGPRISLQYMGLAFYKPLFEPWEGRWIPAHSAAGLAGVCTGITQAVTLVTPLEMLKVRQQTDSRYRGMVHTVSTIVREEGVMALYSGLTATVARQSWGLLVKFSAYIEIKRLLGRAHPDTPLAPWEHMVSGGLANVFVAVLNSPPDVVKTRMQDAGRVYKSTWQCVRSMMRQPASFFRGAWLRVIRIAPGGAIQFAAYEQLLSVLNTIE